MEKCVTLLDSKSPIQAVRMSPGEIEPRTRRWKNASPCLTQKAPYKGLGAESEEKREPVSDIDTGVVDSLKALDPDGRLEKRSGPEHAGAFDEMVLAQGLGDEDRQASREEEGDRGAGASAGRDHASHLG